MNPLNSIEMYRKDPSFWPKIGIFLGGVHAIVVGALLSLREMYYHLVGLELPTPRLYGDMAAWFLIVIGFWLIWSSVKMPQARELWIIPVGSATGRMVYFLMAFFGWLLGITHVIYLYLSLTDVFFASVQTWASFRLRKLEIPLTGSTPKKELEPIVTKKDKVTPFPN